jgi:hypothetical protein
MLRKHQFRAGGRGLADPRRYLAGQDGRGVEKNQLVRPYRYFVSVLKQDRSAYTKAAKESPVSTPGIHQVILPGLSSLNYGMKP